MAKRTGKFKVEYYHGDGDDQHGMEEYFDKHEDAEKFIKEVQMSSGSPSELYVLADVAVVATA